MFVVEMKNFISAVSSEIFLKVNRSGKLSYFEVCLIGGRIEKVKEL